MQDAETLIARSIDHYQTILHEINNMSTRLGQESTDSITEGCARLMELQELAQKTDESIMGELDNPSVQDAMMPLLKKRQLLLEEIVRQNELLFSKITGKMGLINKELTDIKSGMTVMSGYRISPNKTGKIINRPS